MRVRNGSTIVIAFVIGVATFRVAADNVPNVEPVRIVLVGDSTVASYAKPPADRPDLTGWGQVFGEFFNDRVTVLNHAESGASSKSFIREGRLSKALTAKGDYIFIQFGHNDCPGKGDRSTDPNADFQDYLRQYIDQSRAAGAKPILVTPVARRTFADGKIHTTLQPYADAMLKVGKEKGVPVIDLHAASMALFGRLGDRGSANLTASAGDRTHFSRKGARAIAALVADAVRQAVPELRPYLKEAVVRKIAAMPAAAEEYIEAQLRVVRGLEGRLDSLADAADAAAARLLAGGMIYLAGEPGMVAELAGRAGGLCGAKALPADMTTRTVPGAALGKNDVVLFSDYGLAKQQPAALPRLAHSGALVIAMASAENPIFKGGLPENVRPVPLEMPCDSRLIVCSDGERLIPTASPAIAIAQWAYVAELIGACRRQHKQLAVYLSIHLDPEHRRLKRTAGLLFEPDLRPAPVERKQYARQFLAIVRHSLEAIQRDEIPNIRKAGSWLAAASRAHAKIIRNFQGHLPPMDAGLPGDVAFFSNLKPLRATGQEGETWVRENLRPGDVYLLLGYQQNENALAAAANGQGARTIFITSQGPGPERSRSSRHLYVDPHWPITDACLDLPGYDVKACPLSAILGLSCYYAICGEAVRGVTQ